MAFCHPPLLARRLVPEPGDKGEKAASFVPRLSAGVGSEHLPWCWRGAGELGVELGCSVFKSFASLCECCPNPPQSPPDVGRVDVTPALPAPAS